MNRDIRHIVFDIGRVLIHYDPEIPYRRLIPDAERRAHFLNHICTFDWNIEQDRGRSWEEAEAFLIADHPEWETEIRAFRQYWHEMVADRHVHYDVNVDHMRRLIAAGHDVTMLTNFASDTFRQAQTMFSFLTEPRGVTVSGDVKLIKPDPAIYHVHVEAFDLDPAHTLFIDDSLANVEAARAAGWQAIHYQGDDKLGEALAKFGLY